MFPGPNRTLPIGACNFSPQFNTRSLSPNNPWVSIHPLRTTNPRVNTCLLCVDSPRIGIRLLHTNNPRVNTCPLYASSHRINTCPLYLHWVLWVGACGFSSQISIRQLNACNPQDNIYLLHLCRVLLTGAHNSNPRVSICPLGTYSHRVNVHLLYPHNHWIFIPLLCSHSHRFVPHPLRGECTLPTDCLVILCAY